MDVIKQLNNAIAYIENNLLKVYPPASFYVAIKGASELKFRIANIDSIKLRGISKEFTELRLTVLSKNILCGQISTMMFKIKFAKQ